MINPAHNVFNKLPIAIRGYLEVTIKLFSLGFIFTLLNYCVMGKTTHLRFIAYSSSILLSASLILSLPLLIGYFLSGKHFLKIVSAISNLISILIVSVFVLSVFAPAQFGLLDGTELNRQFSNEQHIYDALRFSGCVLAAALLFIFFKNQFRRIGNLMVVFAIVYVAIFAVKAGTVASGKIKQLPDIISHCPGKHGVSTFQIHLQRLSSWDFLGKDKNIIFILLDSFQGSILEAFIKKNDAIIDDFQGFTAYTKAISPFPSTIFSFPVILSGKFYNDTFNDFCDVYMAAHKDSFILDAEHSGFDVKTVPYSSSDTYHFGNAKQYILDNNDSITIDMLYGALKDASARILPISAAQLILRSFPAMADPFGNIYHKRKSDFFLKSLIDNIRIGESSKALFAMHSYVTHAPILWNSSGRERRNIVAVNSKYALDELKYILGQLAGLWDRLKRLGVYDKSLIIIAGDHGTFGYFKQIYENMDYDPSTKGLNWRPVAMHNPAVMIKPPYRKSNMEIHWGAVSLADLRNIINSYLVSDDWQKLANNKKMLDFSQHRKNVVYLTSKNVLLNYRKSQNFTKVEFDGNVSKLPAVFENTFPSPSYELGQTALVNGESPYLRRGWRSEETGAWADERKAYIKFEHHDNTPSDLIMKIEAHALVTKKFPRQRVMVYFNDIKIGELVFLYSKSHQGKTVFKLNISPDVFNRQGPNKTITFESLDLISPTATGLWKGEYKLSLFLYQFSIYPR